MDCRVLGDLALAALAAVVVLSAAVALGAVAALIRAGVQQPRSHMHETGRSLLAPVLPLAALLGRGATSSWRRTGPLRVGRAPYFFTQSQTP